MRNDWDDGRSRFGWCFFFFNFVISWFNLFTSLQLPTTTMECTAEATVTLAVVECTSIIMEANKWAIAMSRQWTLTCKRNPAWWLWSNFSPLKTTPFLTRTPSPSTASTSWTLSGSSWTSSLLRTRTRNGEHNLANSVLQWDLVDRSRDLSWTHNEIMVLFTARIFESFARELLIS